MTCLGPQSGRSRAVSPDATDCWVAIVPVTSVASANLVLYPRRGRDRLCQPRSGCWTFSVAQIRCRAICRNIGDQRADPSVHLNDASPAAVSAVLSLWRVKGSATASVLSGRQHAIHAPDAGRACRLIRQHLRSCNCAFTLSQRDSVNAAARASPPPQRGCDLRRIATEIACRPRVSATSFCTSVVACEFRRSCRG